MKKSLTVLILFLATILPSYTQSFELTSFALLNNAYVSGSGALNIIYFQKENHRQSKVDAGYFFSLAYGYQFYNHLRAEVEFGYRNNHLDRFRFDLNNKKYEIKLKGHLQTISGSGNIYYDFPVCLYVKPYLGAGIGYAHIRSESKLTSSYKVITSYLDHTSENGFAWQIIAGAGYPVGRNSSFSFEYRFFRCETGRKFQNHDVGINFRYGF